MKIVEFMSISTVQNLLNGAIVTLVAKVSTRHGKHPSTTNVAMKMRAKVLIVDNSVHFHYYLLCDFAVLIDSIFYFFENKTSLKFVFCPIDHKMAIE